jgi:hypothetical protein
MVRVSPAAKFITRLAPPRFSVTVTVPAVFARIARIG